MCNGGSRGPRRFCCWPTLLSHSDGQTDRRTVCSLTHTHTLECNERAAAELSTAAGQRSQFSARVRSPMTEDDLRPAQPAQHPSPVRGVILILLPPVISREINHCGTRLSPSLSHCLLLRPTSVYFYHSGAIISKAKSSQVAAVVVYVSEALVLPQSSLLFPDADSLSPSVHRLHRSHRTHFARGGGGLLSVVDCECSSFFN